MNIRIHHGALAALAVALSATPAHAACSWWNSWFGTPTTTYYAPYTASYAPAGCGQTVSYVPQTAYRTVFVNAPVVAYQPVASADPCTGCATTVMRPVTTYVTQQRLVPYTTYRPVVTAAPVPVVAAMPVASACPSGCGATAAVAAPTYAAGYAPAYSAGYAPAYAPAASYPVQAGYSAGYAPAPAAAPACCGASAAVPTTTLSVPTGAPGSTIRSLVPAPVADPAMNGPGPALGTSPSLPAQAPSAATSPASPSDIPGAGGLNRTFDPNSIAPEGAGPDSDSAPEPQSRILVPPRSDSMNSSTSAPAHGLDPEDGDRTTALPLRQARAVRPVSTPSSAAPVAKPSAGGWRSVGQ